DREEVGRPDPRPMVGQEGPTGLSRRPGRLPPAMTADRAIADDDAELEELSADALGAPERILARHGGDQFADLSAEARPAESGAGLPAPEQLPGPAMPAHRGVRPDEDEVVAPVRAKPTGQDPEQLVAGAERRSFPSGAGG